jgi:hypothetical protein
MPFFGFVFRSQEPRAADWNLDRFPFSTEPKIPIGARKLALPVLSTQESSAVAPKQKREGRERKEKKKADPLIASVHFHLLKFPTAAVTGKDLFVLTYTISLAPL